MPAAGPILGADSREQVPWGDTEANQKAPELPRGAALGAGAAYCLPVGHF